MERRIGLRGRTDFSVTTTDGFSVREARGIELSGSGLLLDRGAAPSLPLTLRIEIRLPERMRPILALARPVRSFGSQLALRFIQISDADRLTLAEHLDVVHQRGALMN